MRCEKKALRLLAVLVTACLISASTAAAKKPDEPGGGGGGGGGDPEPTVEGLIYFQYADQIWMMNADGSGKATVPNVASFDRLYVSPSRSRHADQQWFLEIEFQFPGEFYPNFVVDENGNLVLDGNGEPMLNDSAGRKEIVAVSDGGADVLLTTRSDLEILAAPVWGIDDVYVSWVARRWDDDLDSPTFGTILEGGLYVAMLAFDENGGINGLEQQPEAPLIPLPLVAPEYPIWNDAETLVPDMNDHSWSPDGTQLVFDVQSAAELWICDLLAPSDEAFRLLTDEHSGNDLTRPRWSPAGDKILFEDAYVTGAILTINVDGTELTTIADGSSRRPVFLPFWSPAGNHVLYQQGDYRVGESNIIRATASGGSRTKLTRDIFGDGSDQTTLGWR